MKNILLIAASVTILTFFGCKSDDNSTSEPPLTFWHFWSEPRQRAALDSLLRRFEKENDCVVETTELSWNDGKTKLFAAFNAGGAPDVLELGSDWIAQFSSEEVLIPQEAPQTMPAYALEAAKYRGTLYAMPWILDTRVLFYNANLLREAGIDASALTTMEAVEQAAAAIHSPEQGRYGWAANGADAHRLYKKVLPFFWSNGGGIFAANGSLALNSKANIAALEDYVRLAKTGIVETQRELDEAFARGKVGFWISGSWLVEKIAEAKTGIEYGVLPIPSAVEGKPGVSFAGGEYLAITERSTHPLAQKLVNYLTQGEAARQFAAAVNMFPADSIARADEFFGATPVKQAFAEQLAHSRMTPPHPRWLDIEQLLETAVEEALYGKLSPSQALNNAQEKATKM